MTRRQGQIWGHLQNCILSSTEPLFVQICPLLSLMLDPLSSHSLSLLHRSELVSLSTAIAHASHELTAAESMPMRCHRPTTSIRTGDRVNQISGSTCLT